TTLFRSWRQRGLLEYHKNGLARADERYRGFVTPPHETVPYVLEYYVEARDVAGRVVSRIGGPEEPLSIDVAGAPLPPPPWYKRWGVWSAARGAGAAGTRAAVPVSAERHAPPRPPGQGQFPVPL